MNKIRFDYTVQEIEDTVQHIIITTRYVYDTVGSRHLSLATFDNTVKAISIHNGNLEVLTGPIAFLQHVSSSKEIRDTARKADENLQEFWTELNARKDVYDRYVHVQVTNKDLCSVDQRLVDENIKEFKLRGVNLSDTSRTRYKELQNKLNKLQSKFEETIAEDDTHTYFTLPQLHGLPTDFLQRTRDNTRKTRACYKVTHNYPDVFPVLNLCTVRETRHDAYKIYATRVPDNLDTLKQIVDLRREIANILGYPNWADRITDTLMAKTPRRIIKMLDGIREKFTGHHQEYIKTLERLAGHKLEAWDTRYYKNILLKTEYHTDTEEIRQYFPLEYTIQSMLELYAELFSLRFEPVSFPKWHPDVSTYAAFDADTNEMIGYFGMDLYPREGKYSHAAMWDLVHGHDNNGVQVLPVAGLVCNFTPNTEDTPSLLTRDEVETLYHEFGHVIHGLCGGYKSKYADFSGVLVKTDFAEAPSQMIEQWLWSPHVLSRISKHYKTGEQLPQELLDRMIAAKNLGEATAKLRQCALSRMSLGMHQHPDPITTMFLKESWIEIQQNYMGNATIPLLLLASWVHMGYEEYSACYYSYLWSLIIATDLYSRFKANPLSKTVGYAYRREILEPGATRDPDDLIRSFLGRDVSLDSFLESIIGETVTYSVAEKRPVDAGTTQETLSVSFRGEKPIKKNFKWF